MDPKRRRAAVEAGRRWAEDKADALEGTSPRAWPDEWDVNWSGELHLEPRSPKLKPDELFDILERAKDAARRHWAELVQARRALEDEGAPGNEARAATLCEALRGHLPAGLSVGREGARVYVQDVADGTETTVMSFAEAVRTIQDWQERHFGR